MAFRSNADSYNALTSLREAIVVYSCWNPLLCIISSFVNSISKPDDTSMCSMAVGQVAPLVPGLEVPGGKICAAAAGNKG